VFINLNLLFLIVLIRMCCITPVIAAKLFPSCEITVGKTGKDWPYAGTIDDARLLGARVVEKDVTEVNVDKASKLVTTPAFMKNASFFEVYTGIGKMVDEVVKLA
jgi:enhancing lycopene biosynthesis protein 2